MTDRPSYLEVLEGLMIVLSHSDWCLYETDIPLSGFYAFLLLQTAGIIKETAVGYELDWDALAALKAGDEVRGDGDEIR